MQGPECQTWNFFTILWAKGATDPPTRSFFPCKKKINAKFKYRYVKFGVSAVSPPLLRAQMQEVADHVRELDPTRPVTAVLHDAPGTNLGLALDQGP